MNLVHSDGTVLLSPGSALFDIFRGIEELGSAWRQSSKFTHSHTNKLMGVLQLFC